MHISSCTFNWEILADFGYVSLHDFFSLGVVVSRFQKLRISAHVRTQVCQKCNESM